MINIKLYPSFLQMLVL